MTSNLHRFPRTLPVSVLLILLLSPVLYALEPTPWDEMTGPYTGAVTITTKTGKQSKGTGSVLFNPTVATFAGVSYCRRDVKEVVIRQQRGVCCEALAIGTLPLVWMVEAIAHNQLSKETLPIILIASPVVVGMAAVTGPPLLVIEGIRRLIPTKVLYRVVP
jgi:hypothetical protein